MMKIPREVRPETLIFHTTLSESSTILTLHCLTQLSEQRFMVPSNMEGDRRKKMATTISFHQRFLRLCYLRPLNLQMTSVHVKVSIDPLTFKVLKRLTFPPVLLPIPFPILSIFRPMFPALEEPRHRQRLVPTILRQSRAHLPTILLPPSFRRRVPCL